jgi:anti-sigma-K factor RskA
MERAVAEQRFAGMTCAEAAELAPAFVVGALGAAESDAVRRHLADCPELHAEMAELHSVVPALFEAVEPVAPPAGLKDRILAAAAAELAARQAAAAQTAPAQPAMPQPAPARPAQAQPRPAEQRPRGTDFGGIFRRPIWAAVAVAAALAVVALGAWNIQLRDQLTGLEAYRSGVVKVLDAAAQPGAQLAVLTDPTSSGGPSGLAAVAADGSVAMVMRDLKPTTGTQVYEAWLIGADQVPVAIGGFKVDQSGTASFLTSHPAMGAGVLVALTLEPVEPQPGSTTPTPPILAVGMANAQSS